MSGRILVLGAAGRLGRAAAIAFRDAGWEVRSLTRSRSIGAIAPQTEPVELDALDVPAVIAAAAGADLILNALNPPYTQWPQLALPFARIAIAAARESGATLIFPGNLYNFGSPLPAVIDEATPIAPTTRKGRQRVEIETRLAAVAHEGVRSIIVRAGDFYGGPGLGSWFDRVIAKDLMADNATYPGPTGLMHEWAYVPDLAATLVKLAAVRADLPATAHFGFPGHAVTGDEMIAAIQAATGRAVAVGQMPWLMLRLLGPFVPIFRELAEMAYLWRQPHRIDGTRLVAAIGEVPHTPLAAAVAAALADLNILPRAAARP